MCVKVTKIKQIRHPKSCFGLRLLNLWKKFSIKQFTSAKIYDIMYLVERWLKMTKTKNAVYYTEKIE